MPDFKDKLKDLVYLLNNWLDEPKDLVQLESWIETAEELADTFDFSDIEIIYIDRIIEIYESLFKSKLETIIDNNYKDDDTPSIADMDRLLNQEQIQQRTAEWYVQMTQIISASELGNLFASPRQRAKLVISKTVEYQPRYQPLAVISDYMSAFDWGIRFEPVVKQIYEFKYGANVKELGRLYHPLDKRCTASPDGLVYSSTNNKKTGRLIEIKCPVTREINGSIPKDYYSQIQMQLHVTQLKICDYIEAVFSSKYNNNPEKDGEVLYSGYIALVRYSEIKDGQEFYYIYSPINSDNTWQPEINDDEDIVEMIPWKLVQWAEQSVIRNDEWWISMKHIINNFWEDVEKAKRGEFVIPESTRSAKRQKVDKCMIVFNKLDENGE
jgi:hypothetical protein